MAYLAKSNGPGTGSVSRSAIATLMAQGSGRRTEAFNFGGSDLDRRSRRPACRRPR